MAIVNECGQIAVERDENGQYLVKIVVDNVSMPKRIRTPCAGMTVTSAKGEAKGETRSETRGNQSPSDGMAAHAREMNAGITRKGEVTR